MPILNSTYRTKSKPRQIFDRLKRASPILRPSASSTSRVGVPTSIHPQDSKRPDHARTTSLTSSFGTTSFSPPLMSRSPSSASASVMHAHRQGIPDVVFDPFYYTKLMLGASNSAEAGSTVAAVHYAAGSGPGREGSDTERGSHLVRRPSSPMPVPAPPPSTPDTQSLCSKSEELSWSACDFPSRPSSPLPYPRRVDIKTQSTSLDDSIDDLADIDHFLHRITYDAILSSTLVRHPALTHVSVEADVGVPVSVEVGGCRRVSVDTVESDDNVDPRRNCPSVTRTPPNTPRSMSPQRRFSSLMGVSLMIMEGDGGVSGS